MKIVVCADGEAVAEYGAQYMARRLRDAVRRRGTATVALSGGRTPIPMLQRLASLDVPWKALTVYQVDERVASDGHADRNSALLELLPLRAKQRHPMPVTAARLETAAKRYGASLPAVFDVVHLGMGPDGHTASWFPGDEATFLRREPVVNTAVFNGRNRMTLTPMVVNAGRARLVEIVGDDKAEMLARWLLHDSTLPVEHVRRVNTTVLADAAAAAQLPAAQVVQGAGR
jgi:6-phosphogluconolactonase